MAKITYTDKVASAPGVTGQWRAVDANEVKNVVNQKADLNVTADTKTGSYTLVLGDAGKVIRMDSASANNLTVPNNTSVAFPIGTTINLRQVGAGLTTVVADSGVVINGTLAMGGQDSGASLVKIGTNEWDIYNGGGGTSGTVSVEQQKTYAAAAKNFDSGNFRNDASSLIQTPSGNIVCAFTHYGAASGDTDPATVYIAVSTDKGKTWGTAYAAIAQTVGTIRGYPSLYYRGTTLCMLYYDFTGSSQTVKRMESTDDGATWGSSTTVFTCPGYPGPGGDRVIKLSNGKYVHPTAFNTNGILESIGGFYEGHLLVSSDGISWADSGLTITASNNSCLEPGAFEKDGVLYFYWRKNLGYEVPYVTISDLTTFASASAEAKTGLVAPNSTTTIIYIPENQLFVAGHNRVINPLATTTTDVNDRLIMDISTCWREMGNWESQVGIDEKTEKHFIEPSLLQVDDHILITYSDGESISGTFKYNLLSRRVPVVALFPRNSANEFHSVVNMKPRKRWWQTGGLQKLKILNLGLQNVKTKDGHYQVNNNRNLGDGSFVPEIDIKSYNTDRGINHYIDLTGLDISNPFLNFYFQKNGASPAAGHALMQFVDEIAAVTVIKFLTSGTIYLKGLNDSSGVDKYVKVNNGVLSLGDAVPPPTFSPVYLSSPWNGGLTESPTGTFTAASTATGYSTTKMVGDGVLQMIYQTDSHNTSLGLDASSGDMTNGSYDFGFMVFSGTIYIFENSGSVTTGVTAAAGNYLRMMRWGGVVRLQKSTDSGSTWSTIWTYSAATSVDLYAKIQITTGGNYAHDVKGANFS
jgi:hypothetical protein